jgi:hypothetical protein
LTGCPGYANGVARFHGISSESRLNHRIQIHAFDVPFHGFAIRLNCRQCYFDVRIDRLIINDGTFDRGNLVSLEGGRAMMREHWSSDRNEAHCNAEQGARLIVRRRTSSEIRYPAGLEVTIYYLPDWKRQTHRPRRVHTMHAYARSTKKRPSIAVETLFGSSKME